MTYTIVLLLIIILYFFSKTISVDKRRGFYLFSCFLILGLLAGFRYEDQYSDFQVNYRRMIQAYSMNWNEVWHYSTEFIHQIIRKSIAVIFKDPQWYFILSSLFIVGSFMKNANKYADDVFVYILLFYCIFVFFSANNTTRQCIAVAVSLYSWDYLINDKKIQFTLTMLFAVLIHNSAFIFIPLYFLSYKKFTRNTFVGYLFTGTILTVFSAPIINFFQRFVYSDYVEGSYGTTSSNPLRLVLAILAIIAMYLVVNKPMDTSVTSEKDNSKINGEDNGELANIRYDNFILHGTFMFIMCYILSALRMLMFYRVSLYFCPCAMLCIIKGIESQKAKKIIIFSDMVLFYLLFCGLPL